MTALFLKIVNMSITASILVGIVLILRLLFKRAPKWVSVLLWGFVAVRLICPFAVESPLSLMPKTEWLQTPVIEPMPVEPDRISPVEVGEDVVVTYVTIEPTLTVRKSISLTAIFAHIWLAGIAAMLVYMLASVRRVRKSVDGARWLRENLYVSESLPSPFVYGILHPRIYLPDGLSDADTAYVIAHEQAHIARRDHIWKPLGFLLLTLHWFNPVLWISYILFCRDIEMACDERVVETLSQSERADYSEALLNCSVSRRGIATCPPAFGEVSVGARIRKVLTYKKPAPILAAGAVLLCILTAVCFLTDPGSFHSFARAGAGLRFPTTNPHAAELCDISISGQIIRDEFKGTFSVDGRKMEASVLMDRDTPTIGYYVGSRREIFGILLVFDDKLSRFALKTKETNEYILYGMTVEEFEWEMESRNYYVDYLHGEFPDTGERRTES